MFFLSFGVLFPFLVFCHCDSVLHITVRPNLDQGFMDHTGGFTVTWRVALPAPGTGNQVAYARTVSELEWVVTVESEKALIDSIIGKQM